MVEARSSAALLRPAHARSPERLVLVGLAGYFALQVGIRVAVTGGVELDEAEQLLWTQSLEWGYGAQPPLYAWLQWAVFRVTGVSVLGLALLKNLLLFGTYAFTHAAARRLQLPPPTAALAAAGMMLLPQIAWESQRDLTHSVLVTTAAAATLWLFVGLLQPAQPPRWPRFAALGVALAAGLLAKYSYALLPLALAAAALPDRSLRARLWDRRWCVTVAVALLLIAPHALWLAAHWREPVAVAAGKLALLPAGFAEQRLRGLGSLARAVVAFLTPLWIVLLAVLAGAAGSSREAPDARWAPFFRRYVLALTTLFVGLVAVGAGHFKDRWLQPFLFLAPLAAFIVWPRLAAPRPRVWLWRAVGGAALLVVLGIALRVPVRGWLGHPDEQNLPVAAFADAVRAQGMSVGRIVSNDKHLAGALRLAFPQAHCRFVARDGPAPQSDTAQGVLLLVASPPERFEALRAADPAWGALEPTVVELPYVHGEHRPERARFAYAAMPAGQTSEPSR